VNWAAYFFHALLCLAIPLLGLFGPYLTLVGVPYVFWLVSQRDFRYVPVILLLFVNNGFHAYAVIVGAFCVVLRDVLTFDSHKSMRNQVMLCCVPACFGMIMVVNAYAQIGRLVRVGVLEDLWSVGCLFCYAYGRLIHGSLTGRSLLQIYVSGVTLLACQLLTLTTDLAFVRLIFFFGPLSVVVVFSGLTIRTGRLMVLGTAGSCLFLYFIFRTYETFTLIGLCSLGIALALGYNLLGRLSISKGALFAAYLFLFAGVAFIVRNVERYSVSRDYGGRIEYSKLSIQDIETFLEKLRMKTFDDRGRLWRAAWDDITRPPWLFGSVFTRELDVLTDERGYVGASYGAHNLFLHNLNRYRWVAGLVINILFVQMIVQAAQVLRIRNLPRGLPAIAVLVVVTGTLGASAGNYPMSPRFGATFLVLAGVCGGLAHTAADMHCTDFRHMVAFRRPGSVAGRRGSLTASVDAVAGRDG
jgi:hypothetical protein